jgi:adenine-specific DNA-methyltransferase
MRERRKRLGQFFTPPAVARSLVSWVVRTPRDLLLDPSCGDGAFLKWHKRSVGIEVDPDNAALARQIAPGALVHGGDFFNWAFATKERFDAIAGNPPFIRYQTLKGEVRARALAASSLMGADFSALTSSWAPFVLVAAGLLKPGAAMAFVVPAELGHANYVQPLLPALCAKFGRVHVIACREKLFPELSQDCWLLHCSGFGAATHSVALTALDHFEACDTPPLPTRIVSLQEWRERGKRLRPFLLPNAALSLYCALAQHPGTKRFGDLASAGIGYVTGDNNFFHLRPSEVRRREFPDHLMRVAVRKGDQLPAESVSRAHVDRWLKSDEPVLLLDLGRADRLPASVARYLDEESGQKARQAFKCRNRDPWYAVPDIKVPDAFLTVMSGEQPTLVRNEAGCVCTNSLLAVRFKANTDARHVQTAWKSALAQLGAEVEGHPLGGGVLKLEPREAARVPLPVGTIHLTACEQTALEDGIRTMRAWRHNA